MRCDQCLISLVCLGGDLALLKSLRYCGGCHALILTEQVRRHEEMTTFVCQPFIDENAATWRPYNAPKWDPFDPYKGDRFLHGSALARFHAGIDCPRCCPGAWAERHIRHYDQQRLWNYTQWEARIHEQWKRKR